ncbi:MAG: DUF134 domain-containing protein [Candidatus Micrarchaeota archaeon]
MVRPKKCRCISREPGVTYFKPVGVPLKQLKEIELSIDEFEAIRLVDFLDQEQISAAEKMKVSQPTLNRLLKSARKKSAEYLVNGYSLKINGGNYYISR